MFLGKLSRNNSIAVMLKWQVWAFPANLSSGKCWLRKSMINIRKGAQLSQLFVYCQYFIRKTILPFTELVNGISSRV